MVISCLLNTSSLFNEIKLPSDVKFYEIKQYLFVFILALLYTWPIGNRTKNYILHNKLLIAILCKHLT